MKFIFWQNMLSIHQSIFLDELAGSHEVTIVVEQAIEEKRAALGWTIPLLPGCRKIITPTRSEIEELVAQNPDAINVFSGITSYRLVRAGIREVKRHQGRLWIYAEPYQTSGIRGLLRRWKYRWELLRILPHLEVFLATGELGVTCYRRSGCTPVKLFEWGYFTGNPPPETGTDSRHQFTLEDRKCRLLFVGALEPRKNILNLIAAAIRARDLFSEFTIVGVGSQEQEVRSLIKGHEWIGYAGGKSNAQIRKLMAEYDVLALPSLFDGWGAVVNEALQAGMRVLCSNNCGAATLISSSGFGTVFSLAETDGLLRGLQSEGAAGCRYAEDRSEIRRWAAQALSGAAAVTYFLEIVNFSCDASHYRSKPVPPWKK